MATGAQPAPWLKGSSLSSILNAAEQSAAAPSAAPPVQPEHVSENVAKLVLDEKEQVQQRASEHQRELDG